MGKYDDWSRGQDEALLNRVGGIEGALGILRGDLIVVPAKQAVYSIASSFTRDMTKEGWTLLEDVSDPSEIVISSLELVSFLNRNESYVSGDVMKDRAKQKGANLGQRHAEYLLGHQDEIPKEWREYYLVFPGTVWRVSFGLRRVPCLHWRGGRWGLYFRWLDMTGIRTVALLGRASST